ncbi:Protein-lysine N-methyltransferase EEF2KMT [Euphorbia peplus]|nr:Protein-lysine N-methyltransferase EEF2KMT [Euphorbia peplus]
MMNGKELSRKLNTKLEEEDDEVVCLDESFFINDDYQMTTFTFGSHVLQLLCLQSASTDFDLTGQLVWPGAMILNDYLSKNTEMLKGCSVIELGSGIGLTGILCGRFCRQVLLTDHNDEVLKILNRNIEIHAPSVSPDCCAELAAEKLDWGNSEHISKIVQRYSGVEQLLRVRGGNCKFILGYVSRAKMMDSLIMKEAARHGMKMTEVIGSRAMIGDREGVIFEIILE